MKIYVIALAVLLFSLVVTLYNDLGIFNQKLYDPKVANQTSISSDASGIFQVDDSYSVESKQGWLDKIEGGLDIGWKLIIITYHTLVTATFLGSIFEQYVPGVVGQKFGTLITIITDVVLAWGGIQLWRKISSKGMD